MPRAASGRPFASCGTEHSPRRLHVRVAAVRAGAEHGRVEIRQRAANRVRGQLAAQPFELGRPRKCRDFTVEGDYVPRAEAIAVVTEARWPGAGAEVSEIARGTRRFVFVIPGHRPRSRLVASPPG